MKKYFLSGLLTAGLICGLSYADTVTDQKIRDDSAQLKADYQAKADYELRKLGKKIARLQHRTDAALNVELKEKNRQLAIKKAEADRKLLALEKSSGDAWKDLRKGLDDALTDLKVSVDEASNQFKTESTPVRQ